MRLICPNCDAEYEVEDAAIPREGRDVQCSACGHAWFQTHPEVEAEAEAEAALYEAPEGAVAPAEPAAEAELEAEPEEAEPEEPEEAPAMPSAAARGLDASMLAVLKEEAAREASARRAEAHGRPALESQTEMPLPATPPAVAASSSSMAAAVKRIARLRGVAAEDEGAAAAPLTHGDEAAVQEAPKRRKSFPAIEEINQSLRATGDRAQSDGDAVAETLSEAKVANGRSGFRRGFLLLVALAVLVVVLYTFAPVVAAKVPALESTARGYVAAVDAARIALDSVLRGLIGWLKGLSGSTAG